MTDFVTMKSRIADELARSDLATFVGREINSAIKHYESTRFWWNEEKEFALGNTANGTRYYATPANFIRADSLKINYNGAFYDLTPRIWEYIEHRDNQSTPTKGAPREYAVYNDNFRLFPVPDGTYAMLLSYLKRQTDLSGDTDSNGWTTFGEELIRTRAARSIEIRYLRKPVAIAEAAQMAALGKHFLSNAECIAFESLKDEMQERLSTSRLRSKELDG
ncbi:MAG: hypothetical protein FJX65_14855 [Alphaproteobacteria bacterium]|nr:hypothetical protein [Alphaproteobacteria bacterium]